MVDHKNNFLKKIAVRFKSLKDKFSFLWTQNKTTYICSILKTKQMSLSSVNIQPTFQSGPFGD